MSFLSKTCVYGLRAAVYVAAHRRPDGFVPIREIADELNISFHFLTKILQQLTEASLMISYRGPRGGVDLAKDAAEISVKDIIDSIEGKDVFSSCILGLGGCGVRSPCPMHRAWSAERGKLRELFEKTKLLELARQVREKKLRLTD